MAPLPGPPSCAMQRPSTMKGELETKNLGQAVKSSFRQTILPVAASRQESVPRTPRVMTLPSATAGELRGPGYWPDGPSGPRASYLSCQISLPVVASTQRMTSFSCSRVKT